MNIETLTVELNRTELNQLIAELRTWNYAAKTHNYKVSQEQSQKLIHLLEDKLEEITPIYPTNHREYLSFDALGQ
jgi:hypothetical protein